MISGSEPTWFAVKGVRPSIGKLGSWLPLNSLSQGAASTSLDLEPSIGPLSSLLAVQRSEKEEPIALDRLVIKTKNFRIVRIASCAIKPFSKVIGMEIEDSEGQKTKGWEPKWSYNAVTFSALHEIDIVLHFSQ